MFEDFVDNTDRYMEFIEKLLVANQEGNFDSIFNQAYGMGTFNVDELIDIYNMVDNDCVHNYRAKDTSKEAQELMILRLAILNSLSEANMATIAFELAASFFDHFSKEAEGLDIGEQPEAYFTRVFKCIASTGSWSEFFAGIEPVFNVDYSRFSDRIHFDCSRLAGITCNLERGKIIIESEKCHPSFKEALSERKDFS